MISREDLDRLHARVEAEKTRRAYWEPLWQELLDYLQPHKAHRLKGMTPGTLNMDEVLNSTPAQANIHLAGNLQGLLINPQVDWLRLKVADRRRSEEHRMKIWLREVGEVMFGEFNDSNHETQFHEIVLDEGSVGTGCQFTTDGEDGEGLRFYARHISEVYLVENEHGVIDMLFYEMEISARNAVSMFGFDKVPEAIKKASVHEPESLHTFFHAFFPRTERSIGRMDKLNMPIASVVWDSTDRRLVHEGGYEEWPWATPRWIKASGEIYGRSPAMFALPDIRMLMRVMTSTIRGAEKTVDPSLLIPDDGVLRPVKTGSNRLNYYDASRPDLKVQQMPGGQPKIGLDMVQWLESKINSAFYRDVLDLPGERQMTAFESSLRDDRQRRVLGPMLGRQTVEYLAPTVNRAFGLLWRQGKIPQPPPEAEGQMILAEFTSPITQAQKMIHAANTQRALQSVLPLAQLNQALLDNYDLDKVSREPAEQYNVEHLLRSEEERDQMRKVRAEGQARELQAQEHQQQAELARTAGAAAKDIVSAQQQQGIDMNMLAA